MTTETRPTPDAAQAPTDPTQQAFRALQLGFIAAPVLAGLDKFVGLMVDWTQYLWPPFANMLGLSPSAFMGVVGVVEVAAGVLVAVRPRIGGYVVAAWLVAIILNLALVGGFWDIALRDLGLALADWRV
jgi:hypothetical protein